MHDAGAGHYFLHEYPHGAWSWKFDFVQEPKQKEGVIFAKGAQCPFGQWSLDMDGQGLALKMTGWLTNSEEVAQRVGVPCSDKIPGAIPHRHVQLVNGKASATEVCPQKLVIAILAGIAAQLRADGSTAEDGIGMICEMSVVQEADFDWEEEPGWDHIDDVSGKPLSSAKVAIARKEEIGYVRKMKVYQKVPLKLCWSETGRSPIKVKWLDINKGAS